MKQKITLALWALAAICGSAAEAQTYDTNNVVVQTLAGSGFSGYVDGVGQQTMFNGPLRIAADSSGNLFVLDSGNSRVRKITPDATVSTFAGGGTQYEGYGTDVSLVSSYYGGMTIDHSDTLWLAVNQTLCRIRSDGYVSKTNLSGFSNDSHLCVDSGNNLYYSDQQGNIIYRYSTNGVLEVFAGSGNLGSADGNGIFSSFYHPTVLAADAADNIYVWDLENHLLRRINQNRDVVTVAGKLGVSVNADAVGTNATFNSVTAMTVDNSGNVILAGLYSIRKITAATYATTIAGHFTQSGYTNGAGNLARFNQANGVCVSQGMIFVADTVNQRIRNIAFDPSPQIVSGANLDLSTYAGLKITGVVGRTYRVESSANMTNWMARATLLLNSSPYLWLDQYPVSGNKYYRALLLP
jgi:NHL repeat